MLLGARSEGHPTGEVTVIDDWDGIEVVTSLPGIQPSPSLRSSYVLIRVKKKKTTHPIATSTNSSSHQAPTP